MKIVIRKSLVHKYYKREGVKGSYKYYYTKEEYDREHKSESEEIKVNNYKIPAKEIKLGNSGLTISKVRTNVHSVNKSVQNFLDNQNIKYEYDKAVKTKSNYYTFTHEGIDTEVRVSDHTKPTYGETDTYEGIKYLLVGETKKLDISLEFFIDGVNYNSNDFKEDFKIVYKESQKLQKEAVKIVSYIEANTNVFFDENGNNKSEEEWVALIKSKFNYTMEGLIMEFVNDLQSPYLESPFSKDFQKYIKNKKDNYLKDFQEKAEIARQMANRESPINGIREYVAKNTLTVKTNGERDITKWTVGLPSNIAMLVRGLSPEEMVAKKIEMKQQAIIELDNKLKEIGKSFRIIIRKQR